MKILAIRFIQSQATSPIIQPTPLILWPPASSIIGPGAGGWINLIAKNTKFYQKQLSRVVQACNVIKKETLAQVLSYEICQIYKNTFSYRVLVVAASVLRQFSFLFSRWRLSSLLYFIKIWANLRKATSAEAWPWHSNSKIRKITGKNGLKLILFVGN